MASATQPSPAMLQAPQPDTVSKTTAILWSAATGVAVWIVKSLLGAGAKAALVNMLEPKFVTLEQKIEKLDEERREDVAEIRRAIDRLADRRGLPRPEWGER